MSVVCGIHIYWIPVIILGMIIVVSAGIYWMFAKKHNTGMIQVEYEDESSDDNS